MAEFSGTSLYITAGTTDISGKARSVTINENPGESEKIDITHKGDTRRKHLEGLIGPEQNTIEMTVLADTQVTDDPIMDDLAVGSQYNLGIYPKGNTANAGYPKGTFNNCRLISRTYTVPYDGVVEWSLTFNNVSAGTWAAFTT